MFILVFLPDLSTERRLGRKTRINILITGPLTGLFAQILIFSKVLVLGSPRTDMCEGAPEMVLRSTGSRAKKGYSLNCRLLS